MQNLIKDYVILMKEDFSLALQFIIKNRIAFKKEYGNNIVKELILNYRTRDNKQNGEYICNQFKKIIISKSLYNKSDTMIAVNILEKININDDCKLYIIKFLKCFISPKVEIKSVDDIIAKIKERYGQPWI
jgi:hypothetical protein